MLSDIKCKDFEIILRAEDLAATSSVSPHGVHVQVGRFEIYVHQRFGQTAWSVTLGSASFSNHSVQDALVVAEQLTRAIRVAARLQAVVVA